MLEKIFKAVNPWTYIEEWLLELGKDIVLSSYWVCVISGLIGLIMYLFGCKGGKQVSIISPVIYVIIRILGSVLLGV
ncbi:hypothetical protein NSA42_03050 [Paeniclostridium sordellii]|uniref:hypothetical protein n=1 Tax=Paraclostridium sordellii TaxID=1505 RepID=UPI001C8C3209|nr:hypothetical protein [Paeniclostridium sordellii]MBX9179383.1 hypothetical protein [Paeniclostridium sordellii]MCR1848246.1 hypothetical protein [Paeniclostridium sordellii]